jgi:UDP-N-acetylmuramoyl-tripeptide--D-alanyl-D-alanine ligase
LTSIADAKGEIFTGVVPGGVALINRDSEYLRESGRQGAAACGITDIRSFGEAPGADIRLERCHAA